MRFADPDAPRATPPPTIARAATNLVILGGAQRVLSALEKAGVPALVLKGLVHVFVFQRIADGRQTSDIDLLIHERDRDRADQALRALRCLAVRAPAAGLRVIEPAPRQQVYRLPLPTGAEVVIDLHWRLLDFADEDLGVRIDHDALWSRAVRCRIGNTPARRLSDTDLALHSCLHYTAHGLGTTARDLDDIRHITALGAIDWALFVQNARDWGIAAPVWWTLSDARDRANAAIPAAVIDALQPPQHFRLVWTTLRRRSDTRPFAERLPGETTAIRLLMAPSLGESAWGLLALLHPSDSWLDSRYPRLPRWARLPTHLARSGWHAFAQASRFVRQIRHGQRASSS